jgi:hypothetical protein
MHYTVVTLACVCNKFHGHEWGLAVEQEWRVDVNEPKAIHVVCVYDLVDWKHCRL